MIYELAVKDRDTAYIDTMLWLPKKLVSLDTLRSSLEVPVKGARSFLPLWKDAPHHIGVPRASVPLDQLQCELVSLIPEFPSVQIASKITLDALYPECSDQREAFDDIIHSRGGVLNLACGKGKTVIFLHAISKWSTPAIVINDKGHILNQWREEIEDKLEFDGEIGLIQGHPRKWMWENRPIVLASLRSLAKYADETPYKLARNFGVVIWDEIHHLSAPQFSRSASVFPGMRFGATATPRRLDGSQFVYFSHVGQIVHSNMHQEIIPEVVFVRSPVQISLDDPDVKQNACDRYGDIHVIKLAAYVGQLEQELNFASGLIEEALSANRKVLALSMSVDHLNALHQRFPGSGLVTKDVKVNERLKIIRGKQLTFGTTNLAQEALDEPSLDSLLILSEFSSDNTLQQAVGRIQRKAIKKMPRVVIIWHVGVRGMRNMGNKLRSHFKKWGFRVLEMEGKNGRARSTRGH